MRALLRHTTAFGVVPRGLHDTVAGDPRVNIQNDKGKAKAYQVRQVIAAIDKKGAM
ncbi:hypothetical protein DFJ68_2699 [Terracoccus luteus]|uniref:Uncharacterized protein n=1 Tax=Terracoccus luteus TaxID=53356 RepID=A0A495Y1D1_9MICO|nr:hypothetical protein DFJ68_2699 [Terracoccus luteus]